MVAAFAAFYTTITAAQTSNSTPQSSVFVASDNSITFALNVPTDSDDLYFSLSGPSSASWLAIGMGSNVMQNSLVIMVYSSADGNNVTVSPRYSGGHQEPTYTSNVTIDVLTGSGISNGTMTANGRCSNCRTWGTSSIDASSTNQSMIFASGPDGSLESDSMSADIQYHVTEGVFTMDLVQASGSAGVPVNINGISGATQVSEKATTNVVSPLHGWIMIVVFILIMPAGILILRVMDNVKWHGINQAVAVVLGIIGILVGIYISTMYNRSNTFSSSHQILGIVILIGMIAQLVLGYMHHRIYKKTQATTKLAPVHVWLGRLIIPIGVANAFVGFPFALSPHDDIIIAVITALVVLVMIGAFVFKYFRNRHLARSPPKTTTDSLSNNPSQSWNGPISPRSPNEINMENFNEMGARTRGPLDGSGAYDRRV